MPEGIELSPEFESYQNSTTDPERDQSSTDSPIESQPETEQPSANGSTQEAPMIETKNVSGETASNKPEVDGQDNQRSLDHNTGSSEADIAAEQTKIYDSIRDDPTYGQMMAETEAYAKTQRENINRSRGASPDRHYFDTTNKLINNAERDTMSRANQRFIQEHPEKAAAYLDFWDTQIKNTFPGQEVDLLSDRVWFDLPRSQRWSLEPYRAIALARQGIQRQAEREHRRQEAILSRGQSRTEPRNINTVGDYQHFVDSLSPEKPTGPTAEVEPISGAYHEQTTDSPYDPALESWANQFGDTAENRTGYNQAARGKENRIYRDLNGRETFVKMVEQNPVSARDDIEGLRHEKQVLDYLRDTGVVPKAGEFVLSGDGQQAALALEKLPGQDLSGEELRTEIIQSGRVPEVITKTAQSLNAVHSKGILLRDINSGSFMVDTQNGNLDTKLVDFEHAVDVDHSSDEQIDQALGWYKVRDLGMGVNEQMPDGEHNKREAAKKSEMHLWAKTIAEWMLGDTANWTSEGLSPEDLKVIAQQEMQLGPLIRQQIIEKARENYRKRITQIPDNEWQTNGGEQAYVNSQLEVLYDMKLEDLKANKRFAANLKKAGIQVPPQIIQFITAALSPYVRERPSHF